MRLLKKKPPARKVPSGELAEKSTQRFLFFCLGLLLTFLSFLFLLAQEKEKIQEYWVQAALRMQNPP